MSTPIQEIYEKYTRGSYLTDEELEIGIKHFTELSELLRVTGPEFKLAAFEAFRVRVTLLDYHHARNETVATNAIIP